MLFIEDHTFFEDNNDETGGVMDIETAYKIGLDMFSHVFTNMTDDKKIELINRLESIEKST
jgi:hypothetical protein